MNTLPRVLVRLALSWLRTGDRCRTVRVSKWWQHCVWDTGSANWNQLDVDWHGDDAFDCTIRSVKRQLGVRDTETASPFVTLTLWRARWTMADVKDLLCALFASPPFRFLNHSDSWRWNPLWHDKNMRRLTLRGDVVGNIQTEQWPALELITTIVEIYDHWPHLRLDIPLEAAFPNAADGADRAQVQLNFLHPKSWTMRLFRTRTIHIGAWAWTFEALRTEDTVHGPYFIDYYYRRQSVT